MTFLYTSDRSNIIAPSSPKSIEDPQIHALSLKPWAYQKRANREPRRPPLHPGEASAASKRPLFTEVRLRSFGRIVRKRARFSIEVQLKLVLKDLSFVLIDASQRYPSIDVFLAPAC